MGISPGATEDEVKQAYVRLAKIYHPDKNKSPDATNKMAEINLAYETLRDDNRRKQYDHENKIHVLHKVQAHDVGKNHENQIEGEGQKSYSEPIEEVVCPSCGFKPSAADRFCSQCGTIFNHGRCVQCNFVNNSGTFVCLTCGYVFAPQSNSYEKKEEQEDIQYEASYDNFQETAGEDLSEIIRCPQCNEINRYSRGSCWHCSLHFDVEEIA